MAAHIHHINEEQIEKVLRHADVLSVDQQFTSLRIVNGFCNPIYHIQVSNGQQYILKLTNPCWKSSKTRNEAVVMEFLYNYTAIPVPQLISYSTSDDLIGYEYILMTYVEGVPLSEIYDSLTFEERKPYLLQLAKIYADLVNIKVTPADGNKLGCFEKIIEKKNGSFEAVLCANVESKLGPYDDLYDYSCDYIRYRYPDMLKSKYAHYVPKFEAIIQLLREEQKSSVFDERLVLTHTDISLRNTLVDSNTKTIQALIDWEWCSMMVTDTDFETMTVGNMWQGEEETNFLREHICALLGEKRMKTYRKRYERRKNMNDAVFEAMFVVAYTNWYYEREHLLPDVEKDLEQRLENLFERFGV